MSVYDGAQMVGAYTEFAANGYYTIALTMLLTGDIVPIYTTITGSSSYCQ